MGGFAPPSPSRTLSGLDRPYDPQKVSEGAGKGERERERKNPIPLADNFNMASFVVLVNPLAGVIDYIYVG